MDGDRRVNLYDDAGRYRGCLYPERFLLVLRDRKVDTPLDLRPYFEQLVAALDKDQIDYGQNKSNMLG